MANLTPAQLFQQLVRGAQLPRVKIGIPAFVLDGSRLQELLLSMSSRTGLLTALDVANIEGAITAMQMEAEKMFIRTAMEGVVPATLSHPIACQVDYWSRFVHNHGIGSTDTLKLFEEINRLCFPELSLMRRTFGADAEDDSSSSEDEDEIKAMKDSFKKFDAETESLKRKGDTAPVEPLAKRQKLKNVAKALECDEEVPAMFQHTPKPPVKPKAPWEYEEKGEVHTYGTQLDDDFDYSSYNAELKEFETAKELWELHFGDAWAALHGKRHVF